MIYYREYKNIYDKTTTKAFLKVQSRIKYIQVHEWQINIKEDIYSLRFNVYYNYQKKYFFFFPKIMHLSPMKTFVSVVYIYVY